LFGKEIENEMDVLLGRGISTQNRWISFCERKSAVFTAL
jgi:hypothetical protein